jgi:hypothetical protein
MATTAMAKSKTPSILDRVQNESDPELGELIRAAIEREQKLPKTQRKEPLELIRKITVSYTQIKLFDQQIAEVSRKIEAETGPAELKYELLLAKTELEAKLMTEVANLRELMGIIPRHAFEKQPFETLNTWLALNLIDERVYVLDGLKPFIEDWKRWRSRSAGFLSKRRALDYVRERLKDKAKLPIRIDLYHTPSTAAAAENMHRKIVSLAKEANSQMETEVSTKLRTWTGSGVSPFFIREGTIRTLYPHPVIRPDGGPKPLVSGLVNPNDLEQHILWRLTLPKNVPLRYRIEYDEVSALMAKQVTEMTKAVAKRLGITEVVEVAEVLVQPIPKATFLGRWQAIGSTEIQEINFQPQGQSQLTMKSGAKKIVSAPWILATKEIFIEREGNLVYRGYINTEGNLVVEKGGIYPQGSFHLGGPFLMVFKKVE